MKSKSNQSIEKFSKEEFNTYLDAFDMLGVDSLKELITCEFKLTLRGENLIHNDDEKLLTKFLGKKPDTKNEKENHKSEENIKSDYIDRDLIRRLERLILFPYDELMKVNFK